MNPTSQFPGTQWTRLEQVGSSAEGREWFCETYRPAVLGYLRQKYEHHKAEDLCQDFFAKVVLDRDLISKADRSRGSLRGLLRTALDRFLSERRRYDEAEKRGGKAQHQSLDDDSTAGARPSLSIEDRAAIGPDRAFDRAWAAGLLERALLATEQDCVVRNKQALFAALRPMLDGSGPACPHAEIAKALGMNAREVTTALSRLRQRMAKHLYDEVAATVAGKDSVSEEWETVRQALNDR